MWRAVCLIIISLLSFSATAADPYFATLDGQVNGPVPQIALTNAQQNWLQQKGELTLGVSEPDYPPFDIVNFDSKYTGVTADFATVISNTLRIPVRVKVFESRQEAIAALIRGDIDFLGTANGFEASEQKLVSSAPYSEDNPVFAGRSEATRDFTGDFDGVSVAMVYHYLPPRWILQAYPGIRLKIYPSNFSAMGSVSFGENDFFLGNNISAEFLSGRRFFNNISIRSKASLPKTQFAFALRDNEQPLLGLINKVLTSITPHDHQKLLKYWGIKSQRGLEGMAPLLNAQETQWRDEHPVLRVALEDNNEPYSFFGPDRQAHGINSDVIKEVARIAGFQLVWRKTTTSAETENLLKNNAADIAIAVTDHQQSSPERLSFSPTFYRDSYVIVSRSDTILPTSELSAKALRVAVVERDPILKVIRRDYPLMQPLVTDDAIGTFRLLDNHRVDAAIVSLAEAVFIVDNYYKNRVKIDAVFSNQSLHMSMAVSEEQPELLSIISKSLATITPAQMSELSNHWRGQIIVDHNFWNFDRRKLLRGFLVLAASFVFLLFWIIWLRSLIRRRVKAEHKLNDQLTFMKDLIDGTPLPIYVRDREGKLLLCNTSYLRQLNSTKEEMLGKTVYEVLGDNGERADELQQSYRRVIEAGESIVNDRILRISQNDFRIIHHWILPYRSGQGEIIGIIGGWYDISERQQRLERLQTDKDRALQASEAKSTFLTTMSHEIRTPMNVIIGMLELAANNAEAGIVDKRSLKTASGEAQSLLELIGDILDIERAESGHLSLNEQTDNLGQLIHSVCRLFEVLSRRKGLVFTLRETTPLDYGVLIDPLRFKQIISNVLSNALKFTEQGEIRVCVSVNEISDEQLQLTLEIQDSGIGISHEDSQKLFSRFSQAGNNTLSSQQSSGLGLLICKTLCEMMGGTLVLKSELQQGTRINIVLPLHRAKWQPPVLATIPAALSLVHQNVLIADDYAANREVLSLQLASLGHQVTAAQNGREALELWQNGTFDLVITDCNMPVMDGYELTRSIRQSEHSQGLTPVRIVGLTANALNEERQKCLREGMNACLFKPATLAMLASLFVNESSSQEEPPEPLSKAKDFDLTELIQLTEGDPQKFAILLQTFLTGMSQDKKYVQAAFSAADLAALKALAHRIRGGAQVIKAQNLTDACDTLEIVCENEEDCEEAVNQLLAELDCLALKLAEYARTTETSFSG
ncbi:transporter substrate-binding domain-containing protein [Rahnella bruchi]